VRKDCKLEDEHNLAVGDDSNQWLQITDYILSLLGKSEDANQDVADISFVLHEDPKDCHAAQLGHGLLLQGVDRIL
jgi:hypothetical protein